MCCIIHLQISLNTTKYQNRKQWQQLVLQSLEPIVLLTWKLVDSANQKDQESEYQFQAVPRSQS